MLLKLNKEELYQMVLDKNLFPKFHKAETFVPICKQFAWSPRGLNFRNRCVLAVVTDAGSCDLYLRGGNDYVHHKNITEEWVSKCVEHWSSCKISDFSDLCNKVQKIKIEVVTWSHSVKDGSKKSALLLCSHENHEISLWRVETLSVMEKAPVKVFLDVLKPEVSDDIKFLKWSQIDVKRSFLFLSCLDGTAYLLDLEHDELVRSCSIKASVHLWDSADRILISQIFSLPPQDSADEALWVVMTKDLHLIVHRLHLNKNIPVKPMVLHKFTSQITGIEKVSCDQFLCILRNGQIYLASIKGSSLVLDLIEKDISYANYSCHGLALSQNKVFGVLFNSVSRFYDSFTLKQTAHYHVVGMPGEIVNPISEVESALKSGSVSVNSIADIMQAIRLSSLSKDLTFPAKLLESIDFNSSNEYSLQIGLQLAQIGMEADSTSHDKWEKLQDFYKATLYIRYFTGTKLSSSLAPFWLCKVVDQLGENCAKEKEKCLNFLQSIDRQAKVSCVICNSDLSNVFIHHYECSSGHKVPICSVSFQPCLTVPYCICDGCGVLALEKAVSSSPGRCILCDGTFQQDQLILHTRATDQSDQGNLEMAEAAAETEVELEAKAETETKEKPKPQKGKKKGAKKKN